MNQSSEKGNFIMLSKGACAEIVEKKSRFIATIRPVASEEEAMSFIEEMKKKYYDARHNCSAFVIGDQGQLTRSSDDGEPSGTAGRPMLEILVGSEIKNIAVVVTRYFGGTLLGTGGLVRAYSSAVKEALAQCETVKQHFGVKLKIGTDYNGVGKIQYLLSSNQIETLESEYGASVSMTVMVPIELYEKIKKDIIEATSAKANLEEIERTYYLEKM